MTPRFKIDQAGCASVSGIHYTNMRWILDAAFVSFHDSLKKEKSKKKPDKENIAELERQLKIMALFQESMGESIKASHPRPRPPTKEERLAIVRKEKYEREFIDRLVADLLKGTKDD